MPHAARHVGLLFSRAVACNTETCPARLKWCPGTTAVTNATTGVVAVKECSGNGVCYREIATCSEDNPSCLAVCQCTGNYTGSACAFTSVELIAKQTIRGQFFDVLVSVRAGCFLAWNGVVQRMPASS